MPGPDHPIWHAVYVLAVGVALSTVLWVNATKFDNTEIKTIAEVMVLLAAAKAGELWARSRSKD